MSYDAPVPTLDVEQSLDNLKLERDAIVLYDALAEIEKDQRRASAFRRIASNERRHADIWASRLTKLGAKVPPAGGPRSATRQGWSWPRPAGCRYCWYPRMRDPSAFSCAW